MNFRELQAALPVFHTNDWGIGQIGTGAAGQNVKFFSRKPAQDLKINNGDFYFLKMALIQVIPLSSGDIS